MDTWTGNRGDLDARAARELAAAIDDAVARRGRAVLGLVGGRSVGGLYAALAAHDLPWERVHVFVADERLVPTTSPESNFRLVRDDLLAGPISRGRFPPANAHACEPDPAAPGPAVEKYGGELERLGGRFDAVVLSAGEDGHCASLFPGHPSIDDPGPGFILVEGSPKPPARRVSASRMLLGRSRLAILVVYGEEKRGALARLRDPALGVRDCPAKLVAAIERGYLLTDLR